MIIKEIGKEMVKQNNRMTQYVMFVIMQDVEVLADENHEDGYARYYSPDGCDCDAQPGVEDGSKKFDKYKHEDYCIGWFKKEQQPVVKSAGIFFTAKACQDHIDANHYHYKNPTVYGICSWRNPEMQAVQKHLIETAGEKVPSHYA